mgnify:CR=1 FL=1
MKTYFAVVFAFFFSSLLLAKPLYPYQNSALADEARVDDLLARMTLTEKVGQMCQYVGIEHVVHSEKNLSLEDKNTRFLLNPDPHICSSPIG